MHDQKYFLALGIVLVGYFGVSKLIFDKVYTTAPLVVDELYHLPQGTLICEGNYSYWNPKITTLPGLYLVSASLISSYFPCNAYNLRFVNLIGSCINLLLFSSMLNFVYGTQTESPYRIVLQALNLSILPPLYFFTHVYYTDVWSLTFVLIYTRICFGNGEQILMILFGICCILMRQTNVAWIGMIYIHKLLDLFIKSSRVYGNHSLSKMRSYRRSALTGQTDPTKLKRYYDLNDAKIALDYHHSTFLTTFAKFITWRDMSYLSVQWALIGGFIVFVVINKGVVVGDRSAHEAAIHLPQLLYFLLFYGIFALPYVLAKLPSTLKLIFTNKRNFLILAISFAVIVQLNTIVHPYLQADNRHFTFYVWNRWFGRYRYAALATVPVYVFLLFSLYDNLRDQNCVSFLIPYCISTLLVLALQKMIEVRYFLVPYIIVRLRFVRPSMKIIVGELIWYLIINFLSFRVFFTKEVYWKDFPDAQRIMW